jgi:Rps23 Pro-64 3,4-dihydroxylase Tpa1-like proline 4-hydroxylase
MLINTDILKIFDNKKYSKLAIDNHKKYIKNKPYPYIYFDNFLPKETALLLSKEYPKYNKQQKKWRHRRNKNVDRYFLEDDTQFKINLRMFSMAINSRSFLSFIETLSGINSLIPDPYFMGGGAMATGRGGFLNVHADFSFHHKLQAWRQLNALLFLIPNWKKHWNGNLEVWSNDNKEKVSEVEPLFNRLFVFNSTSDSFHGLPVPLNCPKNIYRNVFCAFYFTTKKDKRSLSDPHYTKYDADPHYLKIGKKIEDNIYAKQILKDYKKNAY